MRAYPQLRFYDSALTVVIRFLFDPPGNVRGRIFDPDSSQFSSAQKLHCCAIHERNIAEIKCEGAWLVAILF